MTFIKEFYPLLWQYFEDHGRMFIDFSFMEDKKDRLKGHVPDSLFSYFTIIGKSENGSLICFWEYETGLEMDKQPIVYIDSENFYHSVISSNIKQFLTLLPYSMGNICMMLYDWKYFIEQPKKYNSPTEEYSEKKLIKLIKDFKKYYPNYQKFIKWLTLKMGITVYPAPAILIKESIDAYPYLSNWLIEKTKDV